MRKLRLLRTLTLLVGVGTLIMAPPAVLAQTPAQPPVQQNVLDTLKDAGNFTMFLKAIEETGLAPALTDSSAVTILAPTDEAFAKMSKDQLDAAMADKDRLAMILKNHIIEGQKLMADQIKSQTTLTTAAGQNLSVAIEEGETTIGGAKIVRSDVEATNGVIHVVDAVLFEVQE